MAEALIGRTGFVGSNLARQHRFTDHYRSTTINEIAGRTFDLIVCAGMPAEKWKANQDPEQDRASLRVLTSALANARASRFILISTVDVYPQPVGVDEQTVIDEKALHPYGLHRLQLERFVCDTFPRAVVVRLPGLYGSGLKKNVIYDLLYENQVERIHADGQFQFYSLDRLWSDLETSLEADISLANLVTVPVTVAEVADRAFGRAFTNRPAATAPAYDVRTRHARVFGGEGTYLESREAVLKGLRDFVQRSRNSQATQP